jgi:regulator of sigma E protease
MHTAFTLALFNFAAPKLVQGVRILAATALVLGVMILVHEWGHYIAAKLLRVRVETFAIGFGPRLVGFTRNGTDYRIALLPLGGYVKMAGENPFEGRTGDPGEFMSHPRWHRFLIAVAGPFMNFVLAIVLLTAVYMAHYEHPFYEDQPAVIGWVAENSPAAQAGIQAGDRIVRIDDVQNPTWEEVEPKVALSAKHPLNLAVQRGGQILDKTITPVPVGPNEIGSVEWAPDQPNTITELEPDMPAIKAGLKVGDNIVAVNGQATRSMQNVIDAIRNSNGQPLELTILRNGQEHKFTMTPVQTTLDAGDKQKIWRVGLQSNLTHVDRLPFGQALARSWDSSKRNSALILELVQKMVRRQVPLKQVSGPIQIAMYSGQAASQGPWKLAELMSIISLNLGIFNLLPIPILDGGVILLLIIEGIMRRDISQTIKERIYQAAFVFLVLFAVVVIYNDLLKTIPGLAQRLS